MKPVKPIHPIRAARRVGEIVLRPMPTRGQLRLWLMFARKKVKDRMAPKPAARQAVAAPGPEPGEEPGQGDAPANSAAGYGHVDKQA
jgi:hypothetical protein